MLPVFLPHTCLDLPPGDAPGLLPPLVPDDGKARALLRRLCSLLLADGAQALIVYWPDGRWTALAIELPANVAVGNALELVPVLLADPEEMAGIRQQAETGKCLVRLVMRQPAATLH